MNKLCSVLVGLFSDIRREGSKFDQEVMGFIRKKSKFLVLNCQMNFLNCKKSNYEI